MFEAAVFYVFAAILLYAGIRTVTCRNPVHAALHLVWIGLTGKPKAAVISEFAGQQFSVFKKALADAAVAKLEPMGREIKRMMADPAEIDRILVDGASRARAIAKPVMDEVKDIVGLIR